MSANGRRPGSISTPWNNTAYANAELDALLDQAPVTADIEARRAIMARLEAKPRHSSVLIQPYWRSISRSHRDRVHGYEMHHTFEQHLDKVWLNG